MVMSRRQAAQPAASPQDVFAKRRGEIPYQIYFEVRWVPRLKEKRFSSWNREMFGGVWPTESAEKRERQTDRQTDRDIRLDAIFCTFLVLFLSPVSGLVNLCLGSSITEAQMIRGVFPAMVEFSQMSPEEEQPTPCACGTAPLVPSWKASRSLAGGVRPDACYCEFINTSTTAVCPRSRWTQLAQAT